MKTYDQLIGNNNVFKLSKLALDDKILLFSLAILLKPSPTTFVLFSDNNPSSRTKQSINRKPMFKQIEGSMVTHSLL